MNTTKRQITYILAAVLVLFVTSVTFAQSPSHDPQPWEQQRQEKFERIVKELSLSPQQEQQIAEQRDKEKQLGQQLRQQITEIRAELSKELEKDSPDKAKIYSLIAGMKEFMGKRIEQRVEGILAMKQILTPEQFKALNEKTKKFEKPTRRQR